MALIVDPIFNQTFNIHVWLNAYAEEFALDNEDIKQIQQNGYLDDELVENRVTSSEALKDNFGPLAQITRPPNFTREQFSTLLRQVFLAYDFATVEKSFRLVSEAFTGQTPQIIPFIEKRDFPLGTKGKVRVLSGLDFEWDEQIYYLYNRLFILRAGNSSAPPNALAFFVYVDGTTTIGNTLELQTSFTRPEEGSVLSTEIITGAAIQTDTDGSITGIKNRKFVNANFFPLTLLLVKLDGIPLDTSVPSIIKNSDKIDLGVNTTISTVEITYTFAFKFTFLGEIETNATDIISIKEVGRLGTDALLHDDVINSHGFEVFIPNTFNLDITIKNQLLKLFRLLKPVQKLGFLFFTGYSGAKEFFGKI